MRYVVITAAALAVGGLVAAAPASAELRHYSGGPIKQGAMCQVTTDSEGYYGYWAPCPKAQKVAVKAKKKSKKS